MNFGLIRPAGSAIPALDGPSERLEDRLGRAVAWFKSGTAALARAVECALSTTGRTRVILPAYGCPSLVSAVLYAGGEPVFIDTRPNSPFLGADCLDQEKERPAAVIAWHFLGVPHPLDALSQACAARGVVLIEDSAQLLPLAGDDLPVAELAVYSFGRGKPSGALGGGALAYEASWAKHLERDVGRRPDTHPGMTERARRAIYNVSIRPRAYGLVARLPGTGIGETRFRPLGDVSAIEPARLHTIDRMVAVHPDEPSEAQLLIHSSAGEFGPVVEDLAGRAAVSRSLVRYPLLAPDASGRDELIERLRFRGFVATALYGAALPAIEGVPGGGCGNFPEARGFADRLLTLPVHQDVTRAGAEVMVHELIQFTRERESG